jgi:predicted RNase H-like HicB family nuclease
MTIENGIAVVPHEKGWTTERYISVQFPMTLRQDESGMYIAAIPTIRGCYTQGTTAEIAIARLKEVAELCLEAAAEFIANRAP